LRHGSTESSRRLRRHGLRHARHARSPNADVRPGTRPHHLEDKGLIAGFWGTSEQNRRAKYYRLTPTGKAHLVKERSRWELLVQAVARVLGPAKE
jgi:hypothetical protein